MQTAAKPVVIPESSWEESVSAWMDGEESDDIIPGLLSREGRQTWDTYHLIGDSLRNADLALTPARPSRPGWHGPWTRNCPSLRRLGAVRLCAWACPAWPWPPPWRPSPGWRSLT